MLIPPSVLQKYGAKLVTFQKNDFIFMEGDEAYNFYQLHKGVVKMSNFGDEGDFIQGFFAEGESFGEPALFGEFPYPANAIAVSDSEVWVLRHYHFKELLKDHFDIHYHLSQILSRRLQYKAFLLKTITCEEPEERILSVMGYFKHKMDLNLGKDKLHSKALPLTRQQIADLTGLRVETVIRKIKHLEEAGKLRIIKRKIYFNLPVSL
ncbi:Crp/Fnr family transcriptional regulator [Sphingobacteriales bacterium UPWRP_1]|nr:hypothetical protein B6N25_02440 [Sphingobacteriales bacterium TSM_CSS]PSJ75939.1 Crp/Fnr family transcriptional regulator [Sphingobacteriales bacterium UPWRP_1]